MVHVHLLEVVPAVGEESDTGSDALGERPPVAEVSQQEGDAADGVADVDVRGVVLERLIVPEPLRLFVGVDVASQPGQHGGVDRRPRVPRRPSRDALRGAAQCRSAGARARWGDPVPGRRRRTVRRGAPSPVRRNRPPPDCAAKKPHEDAGSRHRASSSLICHN